MASQHINSVASQAGSKFVVPTLKIGSGPRTEPPKFIIPKLALGNQTKSETSKSSEPPILLLKDLKIGEKKPSTASSPKVDLSAAILNQKIHIPTINTKVVDAETDFTAKFIDCDITEEIVERFKKNVYCEIDSRPILSRKLLYKKNKSHLSQVGKIICRQYRVNQKPLITHVFPVQNPLKSFKFDSNSPDDEVLKMLRKRQRLQ